MIHALFGLCKQSLGLLGACSLAMLMLLGACNDKDEYYDRPSWLEPPIYDVLAEKGNFTLYLRAVDKTLYSSVLKKGGNYTVFAPNDEAFRRFLSEKNYESVDAVPAEELTKLVAYSMVFNKFDSRHLGDILENKVWVDGESIKKCTSYYKTIYKEVINGKEQWVVDSPTDITAVATPYKYLPIFTDEYFSSYRLNAQDYETFFSETESGYSGLNAGAGSVWSKDIYAENGIVHEVDRVTLPLDNLDEMLKQENHEEFRKMLESQSGGGYLFVSYLLGSDATEVYKKLYPDRGISEVYCKTYQNLPYLLNNEDYKGTQTGTTEQNGYTLLVPSNKAVRAFSEEVIRRAEVEKMSDLSLEVLTYFFQAHMIDKIIWPSQFTKVQSTSGEYLNGTGGNTPSFQDIVTRSSFASNGVLYDTKEVVKSKYFNTVYSEILLNKACRNMVSVAFAKFFTNDWIVELTTSPLTTGVEMADYVLVLPTDEMLAMDGFEYDEIRKVFLNTEASQVNASVDDRLKRLLRMCIFKRTKNESEIKNFEGTASLGYDGYGYAVNAYGDMVRYKNNQLQAAGNILDNEVVEVEEMTDFPYNNGRVFRITNGKMLQFSPRNTHSSEAAGWKDRTVYEAITDYTVANSNCSLFKQYLDRMYNGTLPFVKASTFYTVLVPTDEAIEKAVEDGWIPALPDGGASFAPEDNNVVERFLKLSFLSGKVVADDGAPYIEPDRNESVSLTTCYTITEASVDLWSAKTYAKATKNEGDHTLKFQFQNIMEGTWDKIKGGEAVGVVRGFEKSNYIGPMSVIHMVDNVLRYEINAKN